MADAIVMLPSARLAWPALFTPKVTENDDGTAVAKYQATLLLDKDNPGVKALIAAAQSVAAEKWKDKAPSVLSMLKSQSRMCFSSTPKLNKDGEPREEFIDKVWVSSSNRVKPAVVDRNPSKVLTEADGKPYAGCYVNAKISLWAMDHPRYGRRICANILGVQFVKDGDAFSGGSVNGADGFENLAVGETDANVFSVIDDDIPF